MAWPMVLGQMLFFSVILTDNIMVGWLGTAQLAGLAAAISFFSFFNVTSIGIFAVAAPQYAKNRKHENHALNVEIFLSSLCVVALFSIPVAILLLFSRNILPLLGQAEITVEHAANYFDVFALCVPLYGLWYVFRQLTEGYGILRFTTVSGALMFSLNIVLNLFFIFGTENFEGMGIRGAAVATFCTMAVCLSVHLMVILKSKSLLGFRQKFALGLPKKKSFLTFLKVGLPSGAGLASELFFFVFGTMLVGYISYKDLASHQIAFNMFAFLYMIPLGIAIASGIRAGEILAKEGKAYLWKTVMVWVRVVCVTQLLAGLFCFFARSAFVSMYSPEPEVAALAEKLLLLAILFLLGDGLLVLFSITLRANQDTVASFYRLIGAFVCLGIPLMLLLGVSLEMGAVGVWIGKGLGIFIAAGLLFFRVRKILCRAPR